MCYIDLANSVINVCKIAIVVFRVYYIDLVGICDWFTKVHEYFLVNVY